MYRYKGGDKATSFDYTTIGLDDTPLVAGDRLLLASDIGAEDNPDRGFAGEIWEYQGTGGTRLDVDAEDYDLLAEGWAKVPEAFNLQAELANSANWDEIRNPQILQNGDRVKVDLGYDGGTGEDEAVYEYTGVSGTEVDLGLTDYASGSWTKLNGGPTKAAAETHATILVSNISAGGNIEVTANNTSAIDADVKAVSVAVSASTKNAGGLSGAGLGTSNRIASSVEASIDGGDVVATGGGTIDVLAADLSTIRADVAAVSVAAALGGNNAGAISIGISVALNEVENDVAAYIRNASNVSGGDINVKAEVLEDTSLFASDYTDSGSQVLEVGNRVRELSSGDVYVFLGEQYRFTDGFGTVLVDGDGVDNETLEEDDQDGEDDDDQLRVGDIVKVGNTFYTYAGGYADAASVDLGDATIYGGAQWTLMSQNLAAEDFGDSGRWNRLTTIDAQAIAVSVAAAVSGKTAVGISGAGAGARNDVITTTNAFVDGVDINSTGTVTLDARNTSSIDATIVAASAAIAGGGKAGVGASIGAAVAINEISGAQIKAYVVDSDVDADGALIVNAESDQAINSVVVAGSAAIAIGGQNSLGLSGAGVGAYNTISIEVHAFIDGDIDRDANGSDDGTADNIINASRVDIDASDNSKISAVGVGASLAAAFAGQNALAFSIGVSVGKNTIDNDVAAYVDDVDVTTTSTSVGDVDVTSAVTATIDAVSVAASIICNR